jgi:hypothetical protein
MAKSQIGFINGVPENPDRFWEKVVNGTTFTFKKERVRKGLFVYNVGCNDVECEYRGSRMISSASTGLHLERDLSQDEVEQLPQLVRFVSERA